MSDVGAAIRRSYSSHALQFVGFMKSSVHAAEVMVWLPSAHSRLLGFAGLKSDQAYRTSPLYDGISYHSRQPYLADLREPVVFAMAQTTILSD